MHSSLHLVIYFFFVQHLHTNAFAQANGIGKIELYFCSYFKLSLFLYLLIYFIDICSIRLIIQRFTLKFEQNVFS